MTKRMLIDATQPEETRIAVVEKDRLDTYDFDSIARKQIKGNIFLAKVTRVEPSLQACFVEYGGNRQGFLAFTEIHPDYYRIPMEDRQALLAEEAQSWDEDEDEGEEDATGKGDTSGETEQPFFTEPNLDAAADTLQPALPVEAYTEEDARNEPPAELLAEYESAEMPTLTSEPILDESEPLPEAANLVEVARDNTIEAVGGAEEEGNSSRPRRMGRLRRRYKIQEVIKRRQIMLVQAVKEERGQKGAAMTTYISLPGRYCVLMPNSPRGGGVSRKITDPQARRKMKDLLSELDVPAGMSVILRTAGMTRTRLEVKRDLEYLLRLWDEIRRETLQSVAPSLIYEEADIFKRAVRDLYSPDATEIIVAGEEGFRKIKNHMRQMVPTHAKKVLYYRDPMIPLFQRYGIEPQIADIFNPRVELRSGGYIIINPTEALVSIDVNSGKATRERHIDDTALKTNMEAAEEVARQLRLRDLGGLVVIDFIDMENPRHNAKVERKLREAMAIDRARIEIGRISGFGLLELSRQRLHPSLTETHFEICTHCGGSGHVRTIESASVVVMRAIEAEAVRARAIHITANIPQQVAIYLLNHKREEIIRIEEFFGMRVSLRADEKLMPNEMNITYEKGTPVPRQKIDMLPVPELDGEDPVIADEDLVDDEPMFTDGEKAREGGEGGERSNRGERNSNRERGERGERGADRGDRNNNNRRGRRGGRNRNRDDRRPQQGQVAAEPQFDEAGNVINIPIIEGAAPDNFENEPNGNVNPNATPNSGEGAEGQNGERRGNNRRRRHPYRRGRGGGRNREGGREGGQPGVEGQTQNTQGGDQQPREPREPRPPREQREPREPRQQGEQREPRPQQERQDRKPQPSNDAPRPERVAAEGGDKSEKRGWWQKLIE